MQDYLTEEEINKYKAKYNDMYFNLSYSIRRDEINYGMAKKTNATREKVDKELETTRDNLNNINNGIEVFSGMINIITKYTANIKKARIELLESEIEANLIYLYPDEKFKVTFEFSQNRGRETAELKLGRNGCIFNVKAQNGRFVRQLISLSCMYTVNKLRESKTLIMDEALSSSDKDNLSNLKPLMNKMIEDGMQLIVIEHKDELYKDVERRMFYLEKDRVLDYMRVVKKEDIEVN